MNNHWYSLPEFWLSLAVVVCFLGAWLMRRYNAKLERDEAIAHRYSPEDY